MPETIWSRALRQIRRGRILLGISGNNSLGVGRFARFFGLSAFGLFALTDYPNESSNLKSATLEMLSDYRICFTQFPFLLFVLCLPHQETLMVNINTTPLYCKSRQVGIKSIQTKLGDFC